jgi:hypothetical protein
MGAVLMVARDSGQGCEVVWDGGADDDGGT